ncbi:MAG: S41 family peptidase, partial [Armatimonadota bacterium]|nr:S41 family peptidase [Armatimonadota bacterium]
SFFQGAGPGERSIFKKGERLRLAQLFVGDVADSGATNTGAAKTSMPALEGYWKTLGQIQSGFFNPDVSPAPDDTRLTYSAIRGVLSSLNDPYTRFLSPPQYAEMLNENRGSFPGIGVQLGPDNGKIVIEQVVPDSPASAAPLLPGDQILKIGETNLAGSTAEAAGALLKGAEGAKVTLVIIRAGKTMTFTLTRREVSYPHFESKILDGGIGYMHLLMFDQQAGDNIGKALQHFQQAGVKGILFDLRDNPGGLLNAAVDVASKFIPPGTVVWVQERGGQRSSLATTTDAAKRSRLPLVLLVNHYSASASEIVSGAIKDTRSGTLVGLTTWGKGLVQEIIPLNDDSAIALTTAHYFTPNGSDINLKGVDPDVLKGHVVAEPDDTSAITQSVYTAEKASVDSEQLQEAITLLKQKISNVGAASSTVALKPAP